MAHFKNTTVNGDVTVQSTLTNTTVASCEIGRFNNIYTNDYPVGEVIAINQQGSNVTLPSGTWTQATTLTLPHTGTYLIIASFQIAANSSGDRGICIEADGSDDTTTTTYAKKVPAVPSSGTMTVDTINRVRKVTGSSLMKIKLFQDSGSSLSGAATVSAIRLC